MRSIRGLALGTYDAKGADAARATPNASQVRGLVYAVKDNRVPPSPKQPIAEYRGLGLKFRWSVGPGSAPADLGERLARRGLVASWGRGMARSTSAPPQADDPAIRIVEVDATTIDAFSQVTARGWDLELTPTAELHAQILAAPGRKQHLFLAYHRGEPAATASYFAFPRSAYLLGGVVLPQHRGRGLYRALVAARLGHAQARGISLATTHARESSSAPILERLGFATICRFPRYFS
jgi:GNAT superfamily N-acetyltransferase